MDNFYDTERKKIMNRTTRCLFWRATFRLTCLLLCSVLCLCLLPACKKGDPLTQSGIESVTVDAKKQTIRIRVTLNSNHLEYRPDDTLQLFELEHGEDISELDPGSSFMSAKADATVDFTVPLFDGEKNRLYSAFAVGFSDGTLVSQTLHYVTNPEALASFTDAFPRGSAAKALTHSEAPAAPAPMESQLRQWPVQIKLAPLRAPWFDGAKLLIAADCTAYAYANFHQDFMRNHVTLVGCPKLDSVDYSVKLTEILKQNDIRSVTVVRMEVPCCGGIEFAVKRALQESGKFIPWQVVTISTDGQILD